MAPSAAWRSRAPCAPSPVLLCLDEPAAGLNPRESEELADLADAHPRRRHARVLLIEHDMGVVMRITDHVVVLDHGKKIADGTARGRPRRPGRHRRLSRRGRRGRGEAGRLAQP